MLVFFPGVLFLQKWPWAVLCDFPVCSENAQPFVVFFPLLTEVHLSLNQPMYSLKRLFFFFFKGLIQVYSEKSRAFSLTFLPLPQISLFLLYFCVFRPLFTSWRLQVISYSFPPPPPPCSLNCGFWQGSPHLVLLPPPCCGFAPPLSNL